MSPVVKPDITRLYESLIAGSNPAGANMGIFVEKIGDVLICDIEFRPVLFGEGKHTILGSCNGVNVYVDVDKDEQPLAVTIVTNV